ncbi:MAG TPA: serine/threonine-protein kinase [Polyangiaceae bacterium]|nr:serine/threonine-protein kinase [Polyangiaceae bacterium]
MGSGSASNELPTPSSVSGPRFNDPDALSFERPTLRVGRYRILSELGRGGMSNVFLAVASGPGGVNKLVVLKALLPDLSTEPYALAMFLDEARLAAQLNHPNVVQTYEVGTEGDRHVIVMEYLEGQSLSGVARRAAQAGTPLPLGLHLRMVINALEGLHYAHELCAYEGAPLMLVHRDVSPQNVFVTYDGQVKVLDFGIAKATSSSTHTATGIVKGKIAYMAPEQIIGEAVDRRADLYSVGCMLWSAATNQKLWGDTPDVHIMRRVINGDVPTPQSVSPGVDDELNRIIIKALANDPNKRYATALELQHDLEQYAERTGIVAKQKDIARYVTDLFADTRAQLKALVERQLTLIQSDNSSISRERAPLGSSPTLTEQSQSVNTKLAEQQAPPERSGGKGWLMAGLGLVALLGISAFAWGRLHAVEEPRAQPTAPAAPNTTTVAAAAPTRVSVTLKASPTEAKLFLDGEALPSNPTTKLVSVDGKAHVLRAEAPGFAESTTEFSPTNDATISVSLVAVERGASGEPSGASNGHKSGRGVRPPVIVAGKPPAAVPAVAAPPTQAPKANCDSPFFLDKDGIRRVRPECR